jgi:hypothetical protein
MPDTRPSTRVTFTVLAAAAAVSVTGSGLLLVAMTVGGSLSGSIAGTVSAKAQLAWGSFCSVLACATFTVSHGHTWEVSAAGTVLGLGLGLAYASMTNLVVHNVPATRQESQAA